MYSFHRRQWERSCYSSNKILERETPTLLVHTYPLRCMVKNVGHIHVYTNYQLTFERYLRLLKYIAFIRIKSDSYYMKSAKQYKELKVLIVFDTSCSHVPTI